MQGKEKPRSDCAAGARQQESKLVSVTNNTPYTLNVKVPLTGGLSVLSGRKPVARKIGGGGYDFQNYVVGCAK